jgi:hypothetical protein
MSSEISKAADIVTASVQGNRGSTERVAAGGVFTFVCTGPDGQVKWTDTFHNLVVNQGLQDMNDKYFKSVGYTASFFLGLVTGPGSGNTYAATDTLATNPGWNENTNYSGTRKAVTFGTPTLADPSVISNSASPASFSITSNAQVIAGALLCTVASGTSGILFSVGNFTGGDKTVDSGDTLSVTYSFSLDAA